ncbi:MAG: diguanylate cyclase [Marinobacter sp.]|nr:diguanylate cyclase [Marinobacter sp.]MBQ0816203.1 diguanylate cyclase [Marinobacter sp.]
MPPCRYWHFSPGVYSVGEKPVHCTVSTGVAIIRGSESVDKLLQRSDEALYRAKTLGRNRVCAHPDDASA